MSQFETTEEYAQYADGLNYDQVVQAAHSVSKEKYPERHKILQNIITTKFSEHVQPVIKKSATDELKKHISIIKWLYVLGICASLLRIIIAANSGLPFSAFYTEILMTSVAATIIYGLHATRSWARNLVLLWSYLRLISIVIFYFQLPENEQGMKFWYLVFAIFFVYQILMFSKSITKKYFGERGQVIITQ